MKNLKIELKWAVYFSLMGLAWMLLEKLSGLHSTHIEYHMYLTNLFAIPAIWFCVMALKEKKNHFYGGHMSYVQGLISGSVLSLFIALISPGTQWITTYVITPEYFPNVIAYSVESGAFASIEEAEAMFNFENYAQQGAVGALMMGVATTAIAMIFIRSKEKSN